MSFFDGGSDFGCAILKNGAVRCWGNGEDGQLGYGNEDDIGDTELPSSVGPVSLGPGRKARAISVSSSHACVILDNGTVRCWGNGENGRLGYGNEDPIGDNELPSSVGPVNIGAGRKAVAIAAGGNHTCVILDTGQVRCWGYGSVGQLGQGNTASIGDNEAPGSAPPVQIGAGRKAVAITAGLGFTCVILDNGNVRCWGYGSFGRLGYGNTTAIGDSELPDTVGTLDLGAGRKAVAISSGDVHTCALLDNGNVRCWGNAGDGKLGYGNLNDIGDTETPGSVGPVSLGSQKAAAISVGVYHSCAVLVNGSVRCWGRGVEGQLGLGNQNSIGDTEVPSSVGAVALGGQAVTVGAAGVHTCALLVGGALKCWGTGGGGRLGYGNLVTIGDNETPATVGAVSLGGSIATKKKPTLTEKLSKRRDPAAPYGVTASGKLGGGFILDKAVCSGTVAVKAKNGSASVTKRAKLKLKATGCTYRVYLRFARAGVWKLTAKFPGNGSLQARSSRSRSFRAG